MRLWPGGGKAEHRADYSTAVSEALLAAAAGGSTAPPIVSALAAVEICAGLWGRAFASATVTPPDRRTAALTPSTLESMGRELAIRGEAVYALDVDDNGVRLTPAARWEVRGGIDPESWRYDLEHETPGGARKRTVPSAGVIHLRYATRPNKPWAGVSPLGMASETRALAGWIERRLAEETSTSTGHILAVPDAASSGNVAGLAAKLKALGGKLFVTETTAAGWGAGQASAPKRDYETTRLGAAPPDSLISLRRDVRQDVLAAYGVPVGLSAAAGVREAWRQFLAGTISPLSKIITAELSDKLDAPDLALTFEDLRAADIVGRARSYKQLVEAGMDAAKAAQITGLE